MNITIQEILPDIIRRITRLSETPSLDAQVLLAYVTKKTRSWVLAHPEATLSKEQKQELERALTRLEHGEPLPYVIGHWEFFGLDFYITPDVLIPRPETELLVERGIFWLQNHPTCRRAVDVGTGSGCIAISLAVNIPDLHVLATDISPNALVVARSNAEKHKVMDRLEFTRADLLDGISGSFDAICANLPYIPTDKLKELPVYRREPSLALDGGVGGMGSINMLLGQAGSRLTMGGIMLLEIEASQGEEVKSYAQASFPGSQVQVFKDLAGRNRCVEIQRSSLIVHLCRRDEWMTAKVRGEFITESLDREGFIHCSKPEQILRVANNIYRGLPDPVLMWINPELVNPEIRWEAAVGELFPHIYGALNLESVVAVTDFVPDVDGIYRKIHTPN